MSKNEKGKTKVKSKKTKVKTKKPKTKTKKKKNESFNVEIQLNKHLNISNIETEKNTEKKLSTLQLEYMTLAKLHQEYSEKLEDIDNNMNIILSEILLISNKYSTIEEFLNTSELNDDLLKFNEKDKQKSVLDSIEEN